MLSDKLAAKLKEHEKTAFENIEGVAGQFGLTAHEIISLGYKGVLCDTSWDENLEDYGEKTYTVFEYRGFSFNIIISDPIGDESNMWGTIDATLSPGVIAGPAIDVLLSMVAHLDAIAALNRQLGDSPLKDFATMQAIHWGNLSE